MNNSIVYVKFPKAGLGNMLLTWSRGYIFAKLNSLDFYTSSWSRIHYGAWLRGEQKKRLYKGYFNKPKSLVWPFCFFMLNKKIIIEPHVKKLHDISSNKIYLFNKIFTDYDFFKEVRPYREMVKEGLVKSLKPILKKKLDNANKPVIGMHIRRGDFKIGSTITPLSFFIDVVHTLRQKENADLPVTVFTDAKQKELKLLIDLPNVSIAKNSADILDILILAESRYVVLSVGSTFSYWAGFLSDGIVIKHAKEWHVRFKADDNNALAEITWSNSK